jgi:CspA family cold shock protein
MYVTWFYVLSDEALLLRRPAVTRAEPAGKLLQADDPFFHVRGARMSRPAESSMLKEKIMTIGTVKFFNTSKGFGFISPEGGAKDVFVHATALEAAGLRSLDEGQKVSFDIQPDARGSKATNLKLA